MRIAIAGKGGAGKTTIAATFARLAARAGTTVVAVDADSNPNLGVAMGLLPENSAQLGPLPPSLLSRRLDGPRLRLPVAEVLDAYATRAADGVRLVAMGGPTHAEEGCLCSAHATVSALLADLGDEPSTLTIVDLEASPEHLSRGTARHAETLLLVAEPYYRALETVRRLAHLGAELPIKRIAVVANKVRNEDDADAIAEYCEHHSLEYVGAVPWSDDPARADRAASSLLDAAPASPVVASIAALAHALREPTALGPSYGR